MFSSFIRAITPTRNIVEKKDTSTTFTASIKRNGCDNNSTNNNSDDVKTTTNSMARRKRSAAMARRIPANIDSDSSSSSDEEDDTNNDDIDDFGTSLGQRKVAQSEDEASPTSTGKVESQTDYANEPFQSDSEDDNEEEDDDDAVEKSKAQRPSPNSDLKTMTHHELWKCLDTELRVNIGASVACRICMSTLTEPVRTPCLHVFCKSCVELSIQYNQNGKSCCPNCKASITKRGLQPVPTYFEQIAETYKKLLVEFGFAPGKHTADFTLTQLAPEKTVDNEDVEKCLDRLNVSRTWQMNALPMANLSSMQILENRKAVKANQEAYKAAVLKRDEGLQALAGGNDDDVLSFATPAETESQREQLSFASSKEDMEQYRPVHLPKAPRKSSMAKNVLNKDKKNKKRNSPTFAVPPEFKHVVGGAVVAGSKKPPPSALVAAAVAEGPSDNGEDDENKTPKASGRRSCIHRSPEQVENTDPFEADMSPIAQQSSQPTILQTPRGKTEEADEDSQQPTEQFDDDEGEEAKEDAIHSPIEDVTGLCEDTMGALHWRDDDYPLSQDQGLYQGTQQEESEDEEDEKNSSRSLLVDSSREDSSDRSRSLLEISSDRSKSLLDSSHDRSRSLLQDSLEHSRSRDQYSGGEGETQASWEDRKQSTAPQLSSTEKDKSDTLSATMVNNTPSDQTLDDVAFSSKADNESDKKEAPRPATAEVNDSFDNHNNDYSKDEVNGVGCDEPSNLQSLEGAAAAANDEDDDMTQPILTQDSPDSKGSGTAFREMATVDNSKNESSNVGIPATIDEEEADENEDAVEPAKPSASIQHVTGRSSSRQKHRSKSREKKPDYDYDATSSIELKHNNGTTAGSTAQPGESNACEIKTDDPRRRTAATRRGRSRSSSRRNILVSSNPSPSDDKKYDPTHPNGDANVSPKKAETTTEAGEPRQRRSRSSSSTRKPTVPKLANKDDGDENMSPEEGIAFESVLPEAGKKPISKRKLSGKTYSRRERRSLDPINDKDEEATKSALDIESESPSGPISSKADESAKDDGLSLDQSNQTENQKMVAAKEKNEDGESRSTPEQVELTAKLKASAERDTPASTAKPGNAARESEAGETDKKPAARKHSSRRTSSRQGRNTAGLKEATRASSIADSTRESEAAMEPSSNSAAAAAAVQRHSLSSLEKEANTTASEIHNAPEFTLHDIVKVQARTWPGVNKRGGVAKIIKINDDKTYNVKYVLGGSEKNVDGQFLSLDKEPSKRKRADESLPLDLLKELADQGFDTSEAGVQVPAKVRKALREASAASSENTKVAAKEQSSIKRARKTAPASKTLQDKTNRKRDKPRGTENAKKKKARTTVSRSGRIDASANVENDSKTSDAKRKANSAHSKNKKEVGEIPTKPEIPEISNDKAENLANIRYRDQFQAAVERGVLEVLVTSDLSERAKRFVSIFSKMGVKLKIVGTISDNTNVSIVLTTTEPGHRKAGLVPCNRTVKIMSSALSGIPITNMAWLENCTDSVIFPTSLVRTLPAKTAEVKEKGYDLYGLARLAANLHIHGKNALPLTGYEIFLRDKQFTKDKRDVLLNLAKKAGASVLLRPGDVSDKLLQLKNSAGGVNCAAPTVFVCDDKASGNLISATIEKEIRSLVEESPNAVMVVNDQWVFDSISCGKPLAENSFALTNTKAKALQEFIFENKEKLVNTSS